MPACLVRRVILKFLATAAQLGSAKKPTEVSISELLRTIDGPIAPLPCLSRRAYQRCEDCADEATCRIRKVFAEVFWSYLVMIESLTLQDMLRSGIVADQVLGIAASA